MTPHNSQAGKNAPNRSKEGALPVEQPVRVMYSRDRRANIAFALGKILCCLVIRLASHFTVDAITSSPEKHYTFRRQRRREPVRGLDQSFADTGDVAGNRLLEWRGDCDRTSHIFPGPAAP